MSSLVAWPPHISTPVRWPHTCVEGWTPAAMAWRTCVDTARLWWATAGYKNEGLASVFSQIMRINMYKQEYFWQGLLYVAGYILLVIFSEATSVNVQFRNILYITLGPEQNGWHFAEDICKCILLNENCILLSISRKFVLRGPINNKASLVSYLLPLCWAADKPLPELMMIKFHNVIRPQWVNQHSPPI